MTRRGTAVLACLVTLAAGGAAAQDVCVDCSDPNRNYRCTIKNDERVQGVRLGSRAIEFACISEIARARGHLSCRVSTAFAGPCNGQHYEVDLAKRTASDIVVGRPPQTDEATAAPAAGTTANGAAAAGPPGTQPAQPGKGPPETLEELARETVTKSKEQLSAADQQMRKAGDAVGGAVKKTWECMASLFSRC